MRARFNPDVKNQFGRINSTEVNLSRGPMRIGTNKNLVETQQVNAVSPKTKSTDRQEMTTGIGFEISVS